MYKENYNKVVLTITILLITFLINCGIIYIYFTSLKQDSSLVNSLDVLTITNIEREKV
ncbi:MAG: hypothetical protein RSB99_01485 [Bacilli bacterium]